MAQNNPRWTAPSFSFDTADQPTTWRDFYTRAIDYVEAIGIDPEEEYQQKRDGNKSQRCLQGKTDRHFKP